MIILPDIISADRTGCPASAISATSPGEIRWTGHALRRDPLGTPFEADDEVALESILNGTVDYCTAG